METWKELKGHKDYLVSSHGRIMRKDSGKIYSGIIDGHGYIRFDLSENGKRFVVAGHRAVAEAFLPTISGKLQVNHLDGDKTNNHTSNLEWCNGSENTKHAFDVLGRKQANRKPVVCIETNTIYESASEAARQFKTNAGLITRCCRGQRKTSQGFHWKYADVV